MTITQMIVLIAITLLPVFALVALKDGIRAMWRVLALVLGVFAWVTIVAIGVTKLVP